MERIRAQSQYAKQAYSLVETLQLRFVKQLNEISDRLGSSQHFTPTEWFRDSGTHGGGLRFGATDSTIFNRASVNVSQVQYDDDDSKNLASASAISTIIHPKNPLAPSVHIHISWTELKGGKGYWRIMADLNPSIENKEDEIQYSQELEKAAPKQYAEASAQGDRYFFIPALNRHRGVTHFYLENYSTGNFDTDIALATRMGEAAIDTYCDILSSALKTRTAPSEDHYRQQRDYHTLYLFQVLTLDRGTTSGLLVHNQNDVGTLGSLPEYVNRNLLISWKDKMSTPQDLLLDSIVSCLPDLAICAIEDDTKQALANAVRNHYRNNPKALSMQATGDSIPATVDNHK
ncbi:Coproporphyrinogen III oxidase, aerobic [hydrothermal vent metagenome]|uniref:coproporphyrinogen oxidase n=1 Tax=hydrothermal vent metagenome TaxID=652676 RepID=A0A3B0ZCT8_9ZZZZ